MLVKAHETPDDDYVASKTVVATEFLTSKNGGYVDLLDLIAYLAISGIFNVKSVFIRHPEATRTKVDSE
jgi:hypothetical protein